MIQFGFYKLDNEMNVTGHLASKSNLNPFVIIKTAEALLLF